MKTDRASILWKGTICLAFLIAASFVFTATPVQAAESIRWSQNDMFDLLGVGLRTDSDDSYDIEDELKEESDIISTLVLAESESADVQEAEEVVVTIDQIDENGLLSEEEYALLDWTDLAAADCEEYINLRADADADADVVGRIYAGAIVVVEENDGEWAKVSSGNAEGYAASEYLLFGEDARAYTDENLCYAAVVTGSSVRIRSGQSTDSTVISAAKEGTVLEWDPETETTDEWVAVTYNDKTRYISADYVVTGISLSLAMTNEEAEEYESATSYSTSDLDLLAALIYCEAGGECYAGKLAVGAVVMNRVKSSSYPSTISGVIYQSGQFGPASSGKLARVLANGTATSSCYEAAKEALSGVSNVGSCLHFHAGSGSGTQIGNQVFY